MNEIVLDADLKFLMSGLDFYERGELLTALLNKTYEGENDVVKGVFSYILSLQAKKEDKKKHMRELSALGVAARLKKQSDDKPAVNRRLNERKESKESNLNNKNIINLFSKRDNQNHFLPPSLDEVKKYVEENHLSVDAETFVNFYEAHGWMMGKVPICNWQATVRLWQKRAQDNCHFENAQNNKAFDEDYWHELKKRVMLDEESSLQNFPSLHQNISADKLKDLDVNLNEKPFVRFMRRVEKYDIDQENENE